MQRYIKSAGALLLIPGVTFAAEHAHHWSYSGQGGPSHWGQLEHDYAACGTGKNQSPIDIRTHEVHQEKLPTLQFNYRPAPLRIIDNGHSVQVNVAPGSTLRVGGDRYDLVQFHFHHPSEERIDGKGFDMVAHLVHRDSRGRLAVVAVPLLSGRQNALVATLWAHLPRRKGHEDDVKGLSIDPAGLLPQNRSYFAYSGSLTTPPCTEGVRWLVLKSPVTLSKGEIATFAARYRNDARPVQALNGRKVLATQ